MWSITCPSIIFEYIFYCLLIVDKLFLVLLFFRRCQQHPSVSKCSVCSGFFCDACSRRHQTDPETRSHRLVTLSELVLREDRRCSLACPKHRAQTLRFYCADCETAVCVTCTDIEHAGHRTTRLGDAMQDQKGLLNDLLDRVEAKVSTVSVGHNSKRKIGFQSTANNKTIKKNLLQSRI